MRLIPFFIISIIIAACSSPDPVRVLYVTGGEPHDYVAQEEVISRELTKRLDLEWTTNFEAGTDDRRFEITLFQNPDWHTNFDVVIYNMCFAGVTNVDYIERITQAHYESGTAAIMLHCAMHSFRDTETDAWDRLIGLSTYRHEPGRHVLNIEPINLDHPIMKDFPQDGWVTPEDEVYIILDTFENLTPLAHTYGSHTDKYHVVMWTNTYGKARIVGTTLGHGTEVMEEPVFLDFLENGLLWAVGRKK